MITVLCVDDQKHITDVLSRYLTKWGYLVLVASDGKTGWDIIQKNRPEIVLTDWLMPDLEGPGLGALAELVRALAGLQAGRGLGAAGRRQAAGGGG